MIDIRKIKKFSRWLKQNGAEVLPCIRPHEVLRFRFYCQEKKRRKTVGIYHGNKDGKLGPRVNDAVVYDIYKRYVNAQPWSGKPYKTRRRANSSTREKMLLFARDGPECFYCGKEFPVAQLTEEHLLSLVAGGNHRLENKVLSCEECNLEAGHLAIIEKVKIRELKRGYRETPNRTV